MAPCMQVAHFLVFSGIDYEVRRIFLLHLVPWQLPWCF